MRKIDSVVLHCSDSPYGNAALIESWHKARGFKSIGYHYIILNGYPTEQSYNNKHPQFRLDGHIETGRPLERIGAHARGYNRNSIGICLIGKRQFTGMQFRALTELIEKIRIDHPQARLIGHYELDNHKTCPNIDMDWLRRVL
ncbi:N-acetylmuramoyl-L-alanine amidase [bacterium]|nr:N-acetylmuramoyl-L-alanine amidase [bacterium]